MEWKYATGGREKYFEKTDVNDCVCRAISLATGKDYKDVYDLINSYAKQEIDENEIMNTYSSARNGVSKKLTHKILTDLGFKWTPTMIFGKGCKTHLRENELPKGTLIVSLSKHVACVKNGTLYDTYDCSREGNRCVYGYYKKGK